MGKIILTVPLIFLAQSLFAQQYYNDSALVSGAADYAKHIYNMKRSSEYAIYSGILHYPYSPAIEGTAYFQSDNWQKGTVEYDNISYEKILMKYDLVTDQLIITLKETGSLPVKLFSPRVKEFSFSGLKFIYLDKIDGGASLNEGFYQELVRGKITAFCKTTKTIYETITDNTFYRKFLQKKKYHISKNNLTFTVNKKKDLLNILKEHKKEVQEFIKENKLNYRKDTEQTIIAAAELYNKLEGKTL